MTTHTLQRLLRCSRFFLLLVPLAALGAPVTVTIDAAAPGVEANTRILRGYNIGNWMQIGEFAREMRQAPAAALRFPGGNAGDEEDLTGLRLDLFKTNLELLGAPLPELLVQTRVFQGRRGVAAANAPEDAASAVRLARERGLKVPVWEIGNEPDLFAVTRGDASWTPERYCEVFRTQAAAIRREDPQALIAGPAVSGAVPVAPAFARRFIELCGDVVDVLTWHIYPTEGTGTDEAALASIDEATHWPAEYRRLLADPASNPLGHARRIELGVTEYGLSSRSDGQRFIGEQVGALWAAEFALRSAEAGLRFAHYFAYQGTGFHGLIDTGGAPRATYYSFRLLAPLQGRFVPVAVSDAGVWSHALVDGDTLSVVLINSDTTAKSLKTSLASWKLAGGQSFDARAVDKEAAFTRIKPVAAVMLPARSMTVLRYQRGKAQHERK